MLSFIISNLLIVPNIVIGSVFPNSAGFQEIKYDKPQSIFTSSKAANEKRDLKTHEILKSIEEDDF